MRTIWTLGLRALPSFTVCIAGASAVLAQSDRPVAFHEIAGGWEVLGDPELGLCMTKAAPSSYNDATLSFAAAAASEQYQFALSNPAWLSLGDGDLRLTATFHDAQGRLSDYWELDAVSASTESGGPRINWSIDRARNDSASFIEQFSSAHALWFSRGNVPIAKFDLQGSSAAVSAIQRCRAILRVNPKFDPFAE